MKIHAIPVPHFVEVKSPSDYRSMRSFGEKAPLSLDIPVMKRFPMQPEWPTHPLPLDEHPQGGGEPRKPISLMSMTDELLWQAYLMSSQKSAERLRVLNRFAVERNADEHQTILMLQEQQMWHQFHLRKQAQSLKEQVYLIRLRENRQLQMEAVPDWGFVVNAYGKPMLSPLDDRGKPMKMHVLSGIDPKKHY